ncbi:sodium-independent anion transporter, partial [Escherichia coli]|nr:sodium-independent anion transporter [Escherichia coli]
VSIVAAITIAIIAVFIYEPLQFIPIASLGVVLIIASLSLLDLKAIWKLKSRDKDAFYLAIITFISVLIVGVIPGIT